MLGSAGKAPNDYVLLALLGVTIAREETAMGSLYELATTASAFAAPSHCDAHPPVRTSEPISIPFGPDRQQHCVLWEPDEVLHDMPVFYFHGGGYVFGEAESMKDAANVYNARGYRFCSVGFRKAPRHRFPAMVADAFRGLRAGMCWMEQNSRPCNRIAIGGTSAGGQQAALLAYSPELQRTYDFPGERIACCISVAGVADAADLLVKPFPTFAAWRMQVGLPTMERTRAAMRAAVARYSPADIVIADGAPAVPLFAVHGRADKMSPYDSQVRFVEALRAANGPSASELITLEGRKWQHMNTTVTFYKRDPDNDPIMRALFNFLNRSER